MATSHLNSNLFDDDNQIWQDFQSHQLFFRLVIGCYYCDLWNSPPHGLIHGSAWAVNGRQSTEPFYVRGFNVGIGRHPAAVFLRSQGCRLFVGIFIYLSKCGYECWIGI